MSPVCQSIYFLDPYSHTLFFSPSLSLSLFLALSLFLYHSFSRSLSITLSLYLSFTHSFSRAFSPSLFTLSSLLIFFFVPSFTLYRSIVQPICFRIELLSSSELNLKNCLIACIQKFEFPAKIRISRQNLNFPPKFEFPAEILARK